MVVNSFRPVSPLPLFSKVLERLMYSRNLSFFHKHNLFYKYQFGFREQHGTDIALIVLVDKILSALNEGDFVLGVFLDRARRSTLSIMIFYWWNCTDMKKEVLFMIGYKPICKTETSFFLLMIVITELCLSDVGSLRDQSCANYCFLSMSMILQVFFSIIYHTFCRWYQCFHHRQNIPNLITVINNELLNFSEWLNVNKVSLTVKKTKYMFFCIKNPHIEGVT